jgi:hypothetical protein
MSKSPELEVIKKYIAHRKELAERVKLLSAKK